MKKALNFIKERATVFLSSSLALAILLNVDKVVSTRGCTFWILYEPEISDAVLEELDL